MSDKEYDWYQNRRNKMRQANADCFSRHLELDDSIECQHRREGDDQHKQDNNHGQAIAENRLVLPCSIVAIV